MESNISSMAFAVTNNVYIDIVDEKRHSQRKHIEVHNKATRKMVEGIIRFLMGHFTDSHLNPDLSAENPQYDNAKDYIPCFIGFGDGGIKLDEHEKPVIQTETGIPEFDEDAHWTEKVDYKSTDMVREFKVNGHALRTPIRNVTNTLNQKITVDMDGMYFYCKIAPNELNVAYHNSDICISEVGLFAGDVEDSKDMLAYIKLGNYIEDGVQKTNTLYVRQNDTVIIRWIISIAAVGKDSRLAIYAQDEFGIQITDSTALKNNAIIADIEEATVLDSIGSVSIQPYQP